MFPCLLSTHTSKHVIMCIQDSSTDRPNINLQFLHIQNLLNTQKKTLQRVLFTAQEVLHPHKWEFNTIQKQQIYPLFCFVYVCICMHACVFLVLLWICMTATSKDRGIRFRHGLLCSGWQTRSCCARDEGIYSIHLSSTQVGLCVRACVSAILRVCACAFL